MPSESCGAGIVAGDRAVQHQGQAVVGEAGKGSADAFGLFERKVDGLGGSAARTLGGVPNLGSGPASRAQCGLAYKEWCSSRAAGAAWSCGAAVTRRGSHGVILVSAPTKNRSRRETGVAGAHTLPPTTPRGRLGPRRSGGRPARRA